MQAIQKQYQGIFFNQEYRIVRPDGSIRWIWGRTFPIRDEAGQLFRITAIAEDVTERKQMEQAEHEQRMLAEALRDTAAALNSTLDLDEVLGRILSNIGRVVPHDAAEVMLIDPAQGTARIVRSAGYDRIGPDVQAAVLALRLPVAKAANLRRIMDTRQPFIIDDVWAFPDWVDTPETRWVRANLAAPIQIRGSVIGFLSLNSATPGFFTQDHAERLRAFADPGRHRHRERAAV